MARKNGSKPKQQYRDDVELDEVDAFSADKEKVLLEQAQFAAPDSSDDSEEEVMGIDSESDADGMDSDIDAEYFGKKDEVAELEDEAEQGWGKNAYYGADNAEDDETAKHIEKEAIRQQKQHLQDLNMDDYVDEDMMTEWTKTEAREDAANNILAGAQPDVSQMDVQAKLSLLKTQHPEFIPLAKEYQALKQELQMLGQANVVDRVRYTALSTYLGTVASYFAIFMAQVRAEDVFSMKEHPVMESILSTREVWRQAKELPEYNEAMIIDSEGETDESDDLEVKMSDDGSEAVSGDEASEVSGEAESESDLTLDVKSKRQIKQRKNTGDDFVEGEMDDVDREEKRARRRTLRFYTSKIDQAANKKDARFTGDDDLPYKERLFERQQRLVEEARKRGLSDANGADLDDNEFNSDDEKAAKTINEKESNDYYSTVKAGRAAQKAGRADAHTAAVQAAKAGKLEELQETIGNDGKRAINYQILKNKGLTPHRKKENRNARVKKRNKYEKAKKKLGSVRSVFKQPSSSYAGEKTGIKKGITRSVKLV
ncbi:hypothetical protein BABINDRAFT_13584 [Babjeviella inositovora NRRL Y-12698]|uniref:Sas10 C-terminal domain-containing protein n=1 Tax=Babjeviella inositovora NRRL Y-12698 TaxID=984486 RepID=A0A1E3QQN0_9ASCO|nr:uncharacterized protein BABINDRAFT_13584 [Babjeviella inositovora NRRL Y-12698]ODQ79993.1 hypothetical protein BABINDRAFT_13584 [Babjeviella inositovora NRRL Y-12698]